MIKKLFVCLIILLFIFVANQVNAKVKIYLDESRKESVFVNKLDCDVYEGDGGITIGFKAGNLLFGVGPEVTLGKNNSIKWDRLVHGIIARYKELCTRFNSGAITMNAYNDRIKEIDEIARNALEFQERLKDKVKSQAKSVFTELDRETKKDVPITPEEINRNIEEISLKIKNYQMPK